MIRITTHFILANELLGGEEKGIDGKGYLFPLGISAIASVTVRAGDSVFALDLPHQGRCDALAIYKDTSIPAQYELEREVEWPWMWIYDDTERTVLLENPHGGFRIFRSPASQLVIQLT